MKLLMTSCSTLILTVATVNAGSAPVFTLLPDGFWPTDVSADGSIVVGLLYNTYTVGRWTAANPGVIEDLGGTLTAGNACLSEDGTILYGEAPGLDGIKRASIWLGGTNWQNLPTMRGGDECDGEHSSVWGMNGAGSAVVGLAWIPGCGAHGYRWDAVNGMVDLGSTVPGNASRANVVSADGSVVAGWQDTDFGRSGAYWNAKGVQSRIMYNGHEVGEALAISKSGRFMAGTGDYETNGGWLHDRDTNTTTPLPNLDPKNFFATALAVVVSDDGSVVIGCSGGFPFDRQAIIWQDGVPQNLLAYLADQGTTGLEPYSSLGTPMAANENMTAVVGFGFFGAPPAWLVTFPAPVVPCPADITGGGLVDIDDLLALIGAWGTSGGPADVNNDGSVDMDDLLAVLGAWGPCPQ